MLAKRGFAVKAVNARVADAPSGTAIFGKIEKLLQQHDQNSGKQSYLRFVDNEVEYFVVKTAGVSVNDITSAEQNTVFDLVTALLIEFEPDIVIGYSPTHFSSLIRREIHERGFPQAYALCNSLHLPYAFPACDLVFTPSQAMADLYREKTGVDVRAVGQFIDPDKVIAQKRSPKYVTLINTLPDKGLAVFIRLAMIFAKKRPELRFLGVKCLGDYRHALSRMHYKDGTLLCPPGSNFTLSNVDIAEHTDDVRLIYAVSRVVMTPSIVREAWCCVATEAVMNGIPVLATDSGGLREAVGGGGIVLPKPASTEQDMFCLPDDEEIQPYVEALERLLDEDWTERCAEAAAANDSEKSVDRLLELLMPLIEEYKDRHNAEGKSYCLNSVYMKETAAAKRNKQ